MMEAMIPLVIGLVIGLVVGWLVFKLQLNGKVSAAVAEKDRAYAEVDKAFAGYKSAAEEKQKTHGEQMRAKEYELTNHRNDLRDERAKSATLGNELATVTAERDSLKGQLQTAKEEAGDLKEKLKAETNALRGKEQELATTTADRDSLKGQLEKAKAEVTDLTGKLETANGSLRTTEQELNTAKADLKAANEKLATQETELEDLQKTMQEKFENIANKILDEKSEKFTKVNETNIKALIEPLGKDIKEFKEKVTEESKERFSLGEKVKDLIDANRVTTEVAVNLTKALKGEAKTQGLWGEMILERILEMSQLRPGEQYFMEHQLYDGEGKPLRSELEGKKMRPDALIIYPDDRHVIVDSKVSLTAFVRATEAETDDLRAQELAAHVASVRGHIDGLSAKGYEDYGKSLDFVLMFVPSEAAYMAAIQADPDLWAYAYGKRILLQSPTNLITSLKLIVELWKREARNQNAEAIAELGAKLYDKIVGFVDTLEGVGYHLDKAKGEYDKAYGQLKTGRGNLVGRATVLRSKVVDTKKVLSPDLVSAALLEEQTSEDEEHDG